jgi:hypothetical protein
VAARLGIGRLFSWLSDAVVSGTSRDRADGQRFELTTLAKPHVPQGALVFAAQERI